MSVTREWREHYDVLYRKLRALLEINTKGICKTRKQVNKFLRAFVDNPMIVNIHG